MGAEDDPRACDQRACDLVVLNRAGLRRRRIVDAARTLFVTNGFHATGVAQIARQSGVAVGQIYRDFAAKEDIVVAIVEGDCTAVMARESLHRALSTADADAAWHWVCQIVRPGKVGDAEALFAEIIAESTRNERIAAIFARTQAMLGGDMRDALGLLAPGDHVAVARDRLSEVVLSQSLGLMQNRLLRPHVDTGPLADTIVAMIARELDALRAAPVPA